MSSRGLIEEMIEQIPPFQRHSCKEVITQVVQEAAMAVFDGTGHTAQNIQSARRLLIEREKRGVDICQIMKKRGEDLAMIAKKCGLTTEDVKVLEQKLSIPLGKDIVQTIGPFSRNPWVALENAIQRLSTGQQIDLVDSTSGSLQRFVQERITIAAQISIELRNILSNPSQPIPSTETLDCKIRELKPDKTNPCKENVCFLSCCTPELNEKKEIVLTQFNIDLHANSYEHVIDGISYKFTPEDAEIRTQLYLHLQKLSGKNQELWELLQGLETQSVCNYIAGMFQQGLDNGQKGPRRMPRVDSTKSVWTKNGNDTVCVVYTIDYCHYSVDESGQSPFDGFSQCEVTIDVKQENGQWVIHNPQLQYSGSLTKEEWFVRRTPSKQDWIRIKFPYFHQK